MRKMASLCGRAIFQASRRTIQYTTVRRCTNEKFIPEQMELATGLEKRQLLALQAGNDDPFNMKPIKRGPGTKTEPNLVPSAFDSRLVGCVCEEDATHINWMWLHEGLPRRCECGHWFKLIKKAPV